VFDKLIAHLKTLSPVKELEIYTDKIPDMLGRLLDFVLGENELAASYAIPIICMFLSNFNVEETPERLEEWFGKYVKGTTVKL
jgi:hypothetical protein